MAQFSMQQAAANRKHSIALHLCIWAGIVVPILFTLIFTIDGLLKPGYSAMSQPISYLAIGSNGWIQDANFIILGLSLIFFAFGFYQWMRPVMKWGMLLAGTIFLLLVGMGFVNDALFIAAAPGESQNAVHVVLHTIGFQVVFFSLPIAFVIIGWQLKRVVTWRGYGWYSIIAGFVTSIPAFFILVSLFSPAGGTQALGGLFNRIFVIEALAWYMIIGSRMLMLARSSTNAFKR